MRMSAFETQAENTSGKTDHEMTVVLESLKRDLFPTLEARVERENWNPPTPERKAKVGIRLILCLKHLFHTVKNMGTCLSRWTAAV